MLTQVFCGSESRKTWFFVGIGYSSNRGSSSSRHLVKIHGSSYDDIYTLSTVMAPEEQNRKPAMKKTDKTEEQKMSEPCHNMVAYLDPQEKIAKFKEITKWLRESRINEAITHQTPIYKTLIKELWDSANVLDIDGKEVIRGQVNQQNVDVSAEILNTVLQLNDDPEAPYSIPIMCQRSCLLRMKCIDDILGGHINKAWLPL
ncbi:hypothetical protein HanIR_Chr04g0163821 [Helianthus annuus]|nr:hypothetical protein HanIR_Chr04g0163821 [Helianthus annuus]